MIKKYFYSFGDLPLTLRVPEVAAVLGVGRNMAYNLIKSGELKSIRIGRQIRIPKEELLRFMKK